MRRIISAAIATCACAVSTTPFYAGAAGSIPLPKPQAAPLPADVAPTPGVPPLRTRVPGRLDSFETVRVGLDDKGLPLTITVEHVLRITGTGDFFIVVPGPAQSVRVPEGSTIEPAIRRGNIIWQGFSNGTRTLRATIELDPLFELARLPVLVSRRGDHVTITDAASRIVDLAGGVPDSAALAGALDRARALLTAGKPAIAGRDGMPASLPAREDGPVAQAAAYSPVRVASKTGVVFDEPLDGTRKSFAIRVPASMPLRFDVRAVRPPAAHLDPPSFATLQTAMWESALSLERSYYLMGPLGGGSASARFVYEPAAVIAKPKPVPRSRPRPASIALIGVAAMLCFGAGTALWKRS